jgi:DnaD/phage-associated family protein
MPFQGFSSQKTHLTPIPEPFFTELLAEVDSLAEIKVILYAFWFLNRQESNMQYLKPEDLTSDQVLMDALQPDPENQIKDGLQRAIAHNILIKASTQNQVYYFLNTPRGQAALRAIQAGNWKPEINLRPVTELRLERPNIFRLYEENIGPLTPMMSEMLQDAETTYPDGWIEDAIKIAVERNVRSWRYVEAILQSWQKEGRYEKDRRDTQEDRRKYIEGEYGDIIEH